MRREFLMEMTDAEIDEYAGALGVDTTRLRGQKAKLRLIEERRERVATVSALGMELEVPVKRLHDKRLTDRIRKPRHTDEETEQIMREILGQEQFDAVVDRCTDEDGTVDVDAMALVYVKVLTSGELKIF